VTCSVRSLARLAIRLAITLSSRVVVFQLLVSDILQCLFENLCLIRWEIPSRHFILKQLVNLFESAAFGLRKEKVIPEERGDAGAEEDVGVFSALFSVSLS